MSELHLWLFQRGWERLGLERGAARPGVVRRG